MNCEVKAQEIAEICKAMRERPRPEETTAFHVELTEAEMMILLSAMDTRLDELDRRALLTMTVTEETHHQIETEATEALRDRLDKMEAVEA